VRDGKGADARWLIPIGLLIAAAGNYWMSLMNLEISPWQAAMPRIVLAAGLAFIFAPLNVAAFKYVSPQLRGAAVGILALLRNEGGSVGTSMAQTIQERREQFHDLRFNEHLSPLNPMLDAARQRGEQFFLQHTGDASASHQITLQVVSNLREQQASSLAYFDVFWCCAVVSVLLIGLVFVMRRSAAEKGEHSGAE
jgi:DHA2 family multidrug resistance protein